MFQMQFYVGPITKKSVSDLHAFKYGQNVFAKVSKKQRKGIKNEDN